MSLQLHDTATKRIEMLREVVRGLRRLAAIADVVNPSAALEMLEVQTAASAFASAGGFISYCAYYPALFRRTAEIVDKILRGTKPGRCPGRAAYPIRTDYQPQDRQGARPHRPGDPARHRRRGDSIRRRARQSMEIPDWRATLIQRSVSLRIRSPNWTGAMALASAPSPCKKRFMSSEVRSLLISVLSAAITGCGVPAGATMPHHEPTSTPDRPASTSVGTSGRLCERHELVTASALALPLRAISSTWGKAKARSEEHTSELQSLTN